MNFEFIAGTCGMQTEWPLVSRTNAIGGSREADKAACSPAELLSSCRNEPVARYELPKLAEKYDHSRQDEETEQNEKPLF